MSVTVFLNYLLYALIVIGQKFTKIILCIKMAPSSNQEDVLGVTMNQHKVDIGVFVLIALTNHRIVPMIK